MENWAPSVWISNHVVSTDAICVLLLHGVGGSAAMWSGVMKALANQGIAAQACDLPGYGANKASAMGFEQISHQLSDAIHDLQTRLGCRGFILVGHSYGGMIVQDFLARVTSANSLITGVVLLCTSAAFGKTDGDFQKRFIESRLSPLRQGKSMLDVAKNLIPTMVGSNADPSVTSSATEMMGLVSPQTYENAVQMIAHFDQRSNLSKITTRCLLISASEDKTAPPAVMSGMHERIPGSSFVQAQGAGHLLPMEQPDWVAAQLKATFFSQICITEQ